AVSSAPPSCAVLGCVPLYTARILSRWGPGRERTPNRASRRAPVWRTLGPACRPPCRCPTSSIFHAVECLPPRGAPPEHKINEGKEGAGQDGPSELRAKERGPSGGRRPPALGPQRPAMPAHGSAPSWSACRTARPVNGVTGRGALSRKMLTEG